MADNLFQARRHGGFVTPEAGRVANRSQTFSPEIAGKVGWAVRCAAQYLPLNIVCLPQAMAARAMLKRRRVNSIMHFGTGWSENKPMFAHAWLESSGVEITGYPLGKAMTEVSCLICN